MTTYTLGEEYADVYTDTYTDTYGSPDGRLVYFPPPPTTSTPGVQAPITMQGLVGDLATGRIIARVPLASCTWQQVANAPGTMTNITIPAGSPDLALFDLYHSTATAKSFFAIQYDQIILNAGPIWTRAYKRSTGNLTLGAAGLGSLWDHRIVMAVLAEPLAVGAAQASVTTYPTSANMSLGDIAVSLVTQAIAHVGGNLPIVLPAAQGQTPGATRTYPGFSLVTVGAMVTELSGVIGGPEIQFRPRFVPGDPTHIQWVMIVGTPTAPEITQGGQDWIFDVTALKSTVVDVDYDEDATSMGTRAWTVGAGSNAGVLLSQSDSTALTAPGYPLLEVVDRTHTSDGTQSDLDSYAAQKLAESNRPAAMWKLTVRTDGAPPDGGAAAGPSMTDVNAGDYCQINTRGDPFFPDSIRRARIAQIDGDLSFNALLTLAPITAEV